MIYRETIMPTIREILCDIEIYIGIIIEEISSLFYLLLIFSREGRLLLCNDKYYSLILFCDMKKWWYWQRRRVYFCDYSVMMMNIQNEEDDIDIIEVMTCVKINEKKIMKIMKMWK